MMQNQKQSWLVLAVSILSFGLNVVIIKMAYTSNINLLWALFISFPVLVISVYRVWQRCQSRAKYLVAEQELAVQQAHNLRLSHSIYPNRIEPADLSAQIGNIQCSKPYKACLLNVVPMSSTNRNWPLNLSSEKKKPINSGYAEKESLKYYDLAAGGFAWQIGPNFQGCRTANGNFDSTLFKRIVSTPEVRLVEIGLNSREYFMQNQHAAFDMAELNDTRINTRIFQESKYTAFSKPEVLIHFIDSLRQLSGGKPIGIRLCINDKKEFYQICHNIRKIQITPDFIVVEGLPEKGDIISSTHPFYSEFPLYEALLFVSQTLKIYSLDKEITVIAAGRIISGFDILKVLALGANAVCAEVADINTVEYAGIPPVRMSQYNKNYVRNIHYRLLKETAQIMNLRGFKSLEDITLSKFLQTLDGEHLFESGQSGNQILFPDSVKEIKSKRMKLMPSGEKTNKIIAIQ